uniref:G protein-coupled receptor n=1 Tax=Steinernema glaseri TaxID=37863 RepID=A0A1I7ZQI1_9BILA
MFWIVLTDSERMENVTIISNFDMQLLCHGAALLDLILEPYFIYLILRCSPPAMHVYRCISMFAQWQLLLASLGYAVALVCWPQRAQLFRSKMFLIYTVIFACLPGTIFFPMEYILFTDNMCLNFSLRPMSCPLVGSFTLYLICYVTGSIYLLVKLGQDIRLRTSAACLQTVNLVKTVRRNCLCLLVNFIVIDVVPATLLLGIFTMGRPDHIQTALTVAAAGLTSHNDPFIDLTMNNEAVISSFYMAKLRHVAAFLDLVLEPYFLYLIFRCSPPSMRTYRWYLLAISLCNLLMTTNFALLWSPQISVIGQELCFTSSYISNDFLSVLLTVLNTCLFGQWQLLLTTLIYAVTAICDPFKVHLFSSLKFIPITAVFTILPSCFLSPVELLLFTSKTCLNFSRRPSSFLFLFCIITYFSAFTTVSAYVFLKIHRASRNLNSSTSAETLKIVRSVQRNFISLLLLVAVTDVVPVLMIVLSFVLMGEKNAENVLLTLARYSAVSISFYSSISTIITIAITKPYRRKTITLIRNVRHSIASE